MPKGDGQGAGGGRPLKELNVEQIRQLALIDCSYEEIAAVMGCDQATLHRRFATVIEEGRQNGKSSLKKMQHKVAMDGNVTMLIWLGKIRLKQREVVEHYTETKDVTEQHKQTAKNIIEAADVAAKVRAKRSV